VLPTQEGLMDMREREREREYCDLEVLTSLILMMRTERVSKTLDFSPSLMCMIAQMQCTEFIFSVCKWVACHHGVTHLDF
jgi:hypothetical protein